MSLKSDASKYYLGYIWWILEPLLYVLVFYVVFDIVLQRKRADFLVFLMCGKLPFLWFTKSVTQASISIVTNAGLIGKANIHKAVFPLTVIQEGVYRQVVVFAFLFCVVPIYGGHPITGVWLTIIPVILVLYLMILFFGLLGSILVCYARDIALLISLGMIFLMFTSGIFWDIRSLPHPAMTELILTYNPMAFLLDAFRQVLMYSEYPDFKLLSMLALIFMVGIAADLWLMHKLNSPPGVQDADRMTSEQPILQLRDVAMSFKTSKNLFDQGRHHILRGVSLDVFSGETLGIIGRNGCGKTTIMRLLAGILTPDAGTVARADHHSAALLSIGLGFKPNLSGRDNAIVACLLQGREYEEVILILEEIKEFSELGESFEESVKTYSSGMKSRLGFATALISKVDILLIDESLSVGDARFKRKAKKAMTDRIKGKQTVVLVSHSTRQMEDLADRVVWIEDGVVAAEGLPADVLPNYSEYTQEEKRQKRLSRKAARNG